MKNVLFVEAQGHERPQAYAPRSIVFRSLPTEEFGSAYQPRQPQIPWRFAITGGSRTSEAPEILLESPTLQVELQIDVFDRPEEIDAFMRSGQFARNPLGVVFDPAAHSSETLQLRTAPAGGAGEPASDLPLRHRRRVAASRSG